MNVRLRVFEIISWYLKEVSMEALWFEATILCIGSFFQRRIIKFTNYLSQRSGVNARPIYGKSQGMKHTNCIEKKEFVLLLDRDCFAWKSCQDKRPFLVPKIFLHGNLLYMAACLSQLLAESRPLTSALMRSEAELDSECCATSSRC